MEEYEIEKISVNKALDIISNRAPRGLFIMHTFMNDGDYAIDNTTGAAWCKPFSDEKSCIEWLRAAKDENGQVRGES